MYYYILIKIYSQMFQITRRNVWIITWKLSLFMLMQVA